ncbi:MAG: ABC transporter permease [Candidatus Dormibacteraeota bacterium]|uniref:ABC transporter permease n=1 Tax=Candidatus Dormiibacter inghamiae TaxID=3127013 RepID=A0A934KIM6_9BACT|nr:ABC transporter permease [Candidatus Dormibacteraeota bacterium]MBJ7606798.1 ABC transporter permease [Candidatus Dormibacteraeota bacterium]
MAQAGAVDIVRVPDRLAFTRNRYLRALQTPRGLLGLGLVGTIVLLGILAPLLTPYSPTFQIRLQELLPPSGTHPLGTDELGRDLLSRVLNGIRVDLIVAVVAVPAAAILGCLAGLLGAAGPGWWDTTIQRAFDVILAFPAIILGIAVAAILSPGERAIVVTILLANVPIFGRLSRDALISQREREYVVAARLIGVSPVRVLFRHIFPNVVDPLIVQLALSMSLAVFLEGGMSFVGIGIQVPQPSLGNLLNEGLPYLATNVNYAVGPMLTLTALVVGLNLIADALNAGVLRR